MKAMIQNGGGALGASLVVAISATGAARGETLGTPHVNAIAPVVQQVHPILTTGDLVGGYRMAGIPDGLGAVNTGKGTFSLWMNHELGQTAGVARAHGGTGAFVSIWQMQPSFTGDALSVNVSGGADSFSTVQDWDDVNGGYVVKANGKFQRFCSAYLAGPWDGFDTNIFLTGEETGANNTMDGVVGGQSMAVVNGVAWALPRLGRIAHENQVVIPGTGSKTVIVTTEDGSGFDSQVYVYVGVKDAESADVLARNGLNNGSLYVVKVQGVSVETGFTTKGLSIPFTLEPVDWTLNGNALETASDAAGATGFVRPEDGEYDPTNYADYYFDTTGGSLGITNGRLYKLSFSDLNNPTAGGTITMLLDGTEGIVSPDNIAINSHGQMLICEDPNFTLVGRDSSIWLYNIHTGALARAVEMNTAYAFSVNPAYTRGSWETSGVIDATNTLGEGWWIFDVQAHYNIGDAELVEGGQLLAAKFATQAGQGDADGDGQVNIDDLFRVINAWGDCPALGFCPADLTGDHVVDVDDLFETINNWSM